MTSERVQQAAQRITTLLDRNLLWGLWNNPLLAHARRANPLPLKVLRVVVPAAGVGSLVLVLLAWVLGVRPLGALLTALSLGTVLVPVFFAPVAGADRITRQMRFSKQDPRRLTDLPPQDVTAGLALVTLWKLRWPILLGLALTPALVVSVLRLDVISVTTWQNSAEVLGSATAGAQAGAALTGGVPWFRLVLRALAAGVLPWVTLGVFSVMGVTAALALRDASLSPLAALFATVAGGLLLMGGFNLITRGLAMGGFILEGLRLVIVTALIAGLAVGAAQLNQLNARLFTDPPDLLSRAKRGST